MKTSAPVKKPPPKLTHLNRVTTTAKKPKNQLGFTLVNLLVTVSISGILASTGIPAISTAYHSQQARANYNELFTLVQFTRLQAVNYHSQALLCPTADNINCINDWHQPLMIFIDTNNDEIKNDNEEILRIRKGLDKDESIKWNASGSRRYLRFKSDGSTGNQNGRLSYCLTKSEKLYAKQIVMYRSGRPRRGSEKQAIEKCYANKN